MNNAEKVLKALEQRHQTLEELSLSTGVDQEEIKNILVENTNIHSCVYYWLKK